MLAEENFINHKMLSSRTKIKIRSLLAISALILFGFGSSPPTKEMNYSKNKTDYPKKTIKWIVP
jgi:hypothetical protein